MTIDSVFILFRKTDFSTILACLGGKVYWWWGVVNFFFAEIGGVAIFWCRLFVNLGPTPFRRKCHPPQVLQAFLRFWHWHGPGPACPGPYGPELAAPGQLIIWKNILSQICSRSIIWMHTTPGAYLLYVPGALCISNVILEHIWLKNILPD